MPLRAHMMEEAIVFPAWVKGHSGLRPLHSIFWESFTPEATRNGYGITSCDRKGLALALLRLLVLRLCDLQE